MELDKMEEMLSGKPLFFPCFPVAFCNDNETIIKDEYESNNISNIYVSPNVVDILRQTMNDNTSLNGLNPKSNINIINNDSIISNIINKSEQHYAPQKNVSKIVLTPKIIQSIQPNKPKSIIIHNKFGDFILLGKYESKKHKILWYIQGKTMMNDIIIEIYIQCNEMKKYIDIDVNACESINKYLIKTKTKSENNISCYFTFIDVHTPTITSLTDKTPINANENYKKLRDLLSVKTNMNRHKFSNKSSNKLPKIIKPHIKNGDLTVMTFKSNELKQKINKQYGRNDIKDIIYPNQKIIQKDMKIYFEKYFKINMEGQSDPILYGCNNMKLKNVVKLYDKNSKQKSVKARIDLKADIILGEYVGCHYLLDEWLQYYKDIKIRHKYILGTNFNYNDCNYAILIDAFDYKLNSILHHINNNPINNVELVSVLVNGYPRIMIKTTKDINKNDDLYLNYNDLDGILFE